VLKGESSGQPLTSEISSLCVSTLFGQYRPGRELIGDATHSQILRMNGHLPRGYREIPESSASSEADRSEKVQCHNFDMHLFGRSDRLVPPEKRALSPQIHADAHRSDQCGIRHRK
jgi:hypothetical protein